MGKVLFVAQGIEDKQPGSPYLIFFGLINFIGIGDIGEIPETKAKDRHFEVPHQDGGHRDITNLERLQRNRIQADFRQSGVFGIRKSIWKFTQYDFLGHFIGKNLHRLLRKEIVGPDIIQSGNMVLMGMGKNNGIQVAYLRPQHLVTEVRC